MYITTYFIVLAIYLVFFVFVFLVKEDLGSRIFWWQKCATYSFLSLSKRKTNLIVFFLFIQAASLQNYLNMDPSMNNKRQKVGGIFWLYLLFDTFSPNIWVKK